MARPPQERTAHSANIHTYSASRPERGREFAIDILAPSPLGYPLVTKGRLLSAIFLLALVMGPGPGATFIDGSPEAPLFLLGIPALYVWLVLWFLVMAGCIITAAVTLWNDED